MTRERFGVFMLGVLVASTVWCGASFWLMDVPSFKIATAYVCGKLDQMMQSRDEPLSPLCDEERATYLRVGGGRSS